VLLALGSGAACACACARIDRLAPVADGSASQARDGARPSGGGDLSFDGAGRAPPPAEIFAHGERTLYRFNPLTREFSVVGDFSCFTSEFTLAVMLDIALDASGNMIGAATIQSGHGDISDRLVSIDKTTAACTFVKLGSFPNSLAYVPVGTLLPDREALVGYEDDVYVRIDPTSGLTATVGHLNVGGATDWVSSGDIVSVEGGGTYLTVVPRGNPPPDAGGDRIVEVDPATGQMIRMIGPTGASGLYGLGYWGGVAYGFSSGGTLVRIDLTNGASTVIPLTNVPAEGLKFLGAGTTTAAPIVE
jgi:hypothetical protein